MATMTSPPLHRVVSDTDEMDVVSSSSAENSTTPRRRDTPAFPSPMSSLRFFGNENMSLEDNCVGFMQPYELPVQCRSFPEHPSMFTGALHHSGQMTGFSSMSADAILYPTDVVAATPLQSENDDDDDDAAEGDDTESITTAQSSGSYNNNDHDDGNNPLLASTTHASQKSMSSQRSNLSARSGQSARSSQSWGQLTEIDLPPVVNDMEAPTYVLEESPSSQKLWKQTAGHRPPQPVEERAFFEKMWAENFARSEVQYGVPVDYLVTSAAVAAPTIVEEEDPVGSDSVYSSIFSVATPSFRNSRNEDVAEALLISRMNNMIGMDSSSPIRNSAQRQLLDNDTTVLLKGLNAFGTTVSKSFAQTDGDGLMNATTVNISIASYRVVESKRSGRHAQFHVIYREGNMRDTIGVWKRYRDFENLANKISDSCEGCSMLHSSQHAMEPEVEHLPNAITSWRLMKKRKRWYRCLDAGYLSLKVFLLERFLHDVLFESSSPLLLRDFVFASLGDDTPSTSAPNSP